MPTTSSYFCIDTMLHKDDFEQVGTLGRPHGLQGEISARLTVDLSSLIQDDQPPLFLMLEEDGLLIPFRLEGWRTKAGDIDLLKFADIDDCKCAEGYIGRAVWLDKEYLSVDEEEAIDLFDFAHYVGYAVHAAATGEYIGIVSAVDETTINTLLLVSREGDEQELILPIAHELLEGVCPESKTLRLQIPDGLLDI